MKATNPPLAQRPALLLAAALMSPVPALGTSGVRAQSPDETSATVDILVLDRDGNTYSGLTARDFRVVGGGNRGEDRHRLTVEDAQSVSPDAEARRFVFVVNRRGATQVQLQRMRTGLERFVADRFADRDEAMFVDFAGTPRISRRWLRGGTDVLREVRDLPSVGFASPSGPEADSADAAFMLAALAERLSGTPGRKVVVLFSTSLSTFVGVPAGWVTPTRMRGSGPPTGRAGNDGGLSLLSRGFTVAQAAVYAVHLGGSQRQQDDGILVSDRSEWIGGLSATTDAGAAQGRQRQRGSSASLEGRRRAAFDRPTNDFLSSLAAETGGAYTARATDFAAVLRDIERSNRLVYRLSVSGHDPSTTWIEALDVTLPDHPELRVVAPPRTFLPN